MSSYKTWWIVGLWVQGYRVCPVCINSGKSKPPGRQRGRHVQACQLKSRYQEPLSTSWNSSSCHLFSSGIKHRLKAQDVGCRQLPSFWTCSSAITVWVLWRYPCCLSISSIPSVSSTLPLLQPVSSVSSPDEKIEQSFETPTLLWLLLFFSFCHFASNHHLEIYPTIKSFSRNSAPQSWNVRWSRSGWAVQSQSWSLFTLLLWCCRQRRHVKASLIQNGHHPYHQCK